MSDSIWGDATYGSDMRYKLYCDIKGKLSIAETDLKNSKRRIEQLKEDAQSRNEEIRRMRASLKSAHTQLLSAYSDLQDNISYDRCINSAEMHNMRDSLRELAKYLNENRIGEYVDPEEDK